MYWSYLFPGVQMKDQTIQDKSQEMEKHKVYKLSLPLRFISYLDTDHIGFQDSGWTERNIIITTLTQNRSISFEIQRQ